VHRGLGVQHLPRPRRVQAVSLCNPSTGKCDPFPNKPNGTPCDDATPAPRTTPAGGRVHRTASANACPPPTRASGLHLQRRHPRLRPYPNQPNGTACDDGDPCTSGETCLNGVCMAPRRRAARRPTPATRRASATRPPGTARRATRTSPTAPPATTATPAPPTTSAPTGSARARRRPAAAPPTSASGRHLQPDHRPVLGLGQARRHRLQRRRRRHRERPVHRGRHLQGHAQGPGLCYGKATGTPCDDHNACTRDDFCVDNACNGNQPSPASPRPTTATGPGHL
jgi:hypothetical protein